MGKEKKLYLNVIFLEQKPLKLKFIEYEENI